MFSQLQVFILSYNRAEWLESCIRSFLCQSYREFTLTVLDNASDQDIRGIVERLGDSRLSLIQNESNIGGIKSFRKACEIASADYFMVFHDDDVAHPRLLEFLMQIAQQVRDASCIVSNCNVVSEMSKMEQFDEIPVPSFSILASDAELYSIGLNGVDRAIGFGATLYRTLAVKESLSLLDELTSRLSLVFDRAWIAVLARKGRSVFVDSHLYNARSHSTQDSQRLSKEYLYSLEFLKHQREMFQDLMQGDILREWQKRVVSTFTGAIRWHLINDVHGLPKILTTLINQDFVHPFRLLILCTGQVLIMALKRVVRIVAERLPIRGRSTSRT